MQFQNLSKECFEAVFRHFKGLKGKVFIAAGDFRYVVVLDFSSLNTIVINNFLHFVIQKGK